MRIPDSQIIGKTYGRLTAIKEVKQTQKWVRRFLFLCECGEQKEINLKTIRASNQPSCGCLLSENAKKHMTKVGKANKTHGKKHTPEYGIWVSMKQRRYNKNDRRFNDYGGRGIRVCEAWRKDFLVFLNDVGKRPSASHSLDRINNNGNYELINCRWATRIEQARNRRNNILIEYNGKNQTLTEWAKELGIKKHIIHKRIKLGWQVKQIMETKVAVRRKRTCT